MQLGTHHCLQTFVLPPRENNLFLAIKSDNYFLWKKFFVVCFPYYVCYHLMFFFGQHIFHQFQQQTFFCPHFQQTFFFTFVATNYFFLAPPPPQISNGASRIFYQQDQRFTRA